MHLVGIDIFSGKKYEDMCPSTHNMDVPHVKREDYQLTDIDDGFLVLMSDDGDLREDLKIPDGELGVQLRADYDAGKDLLVSIFLNLRTLPMIELNKVKQVITSQSRLIVQFLFPNIDIVVQIRIRTASCTITLQFLMYILTEICGCN